MSAIVIGSILLAATSSLASSQMNQLRDDILSVGDQRTNCANFGGSWKGVCSTKRSGEAGQTQHESTMTFKQTGCTLLQAIEFGPSYIGTVTNESISSPRGVLSTSGSTYWLDDGQKLGMASGFSLVKYEGKGVIYTGEVLGAFSVDGDAIVGKVTHKVAKRDMNDDSVTNTNEESDCRLLRQ